MPQSPDNMPSALNRERRGQRDEPGEQPSPKDRLREMGGRGPEDTVPLAEAALLMAAARRPDITIAPYLRHLERLADEVRAYAGPDPSLASLDLQIEAFRQVVFGRYGYGGGDGVFEDLDAADLARVIDTRRGLPVSLGIIILEVAQRLGWHVVGIDFPGRFLLRIEGQDGRKMLDVFSGCTEMPVYELRALVKAIEGLDGELTQRHFREMGWRNVLLRLQENIRARQMQRGQPEDALVTLELMLLIAPGAGHLWREIGLLNARLDRIKDAVDALETFQRLDSGTEIGEGSNYQVSLLLQELRSRLN